MSAYLNSFSAGARQVAPLSLGIMPFGLICGAVCVSTGMPEWAGISFSAIIFAGAGQLVANQLMAEQASMAVVIFTGLVINLRMFMYSASLAPHFKGVHPLKKALLAYVLSDLAFALSIGRFNESDKEDINKPAFYFGAALIVWVCFNLTTVLGVYLGAFIPLEWDLGFAIPLTFTAVLVPAIKDRPVLLAAVVAGGVGLLGNGLPYNLGLMVGCICGILAGFFAERRMTDG